MITLSDFFCICASPDDYSAIEKFNLKKQKVRKFDYILVECEKALESGLIGCYTY